MTAGDLAATDHLAEDTHPETSDETNHATGISRENETFSETLVARFVRETLTSEKATLEDHEIGTRENPPGKIISIGKVTLTGAGTLMHNEISTAKEGWIVQLSSKEVEISMDQESLRGRENSGGSGLSENPLLEASMHPTGPNQTSDLTRAIR